MEMVTICTRLNSTTMGNGKTNKRMAVVSLPLTVEYTMGSGSKIKLQVVEI